MATMMTSTMTSKACTRISASKAGFMGGLRPLQIQSMTMARPARGQPLVVKAERGPGFWSGFVVGGVVAGVLGYVFAPQISRALLGEEQRIRLPRFMDDEDEDPEITKQNLADKIAQLNSAIDDVSAQLKSQESMEEVTSA
ncbi:hypothetical protein Ndes2526B_g05421 [Nannochloris sp. 'desiccata']|nr:hypothetical protein KSW81_007302 [Chlorella desiccata (nom. nud.)]KAH7618523.1 hypothetical protein NADE_005373 [Chlorella desiccata (nom. nud.)]